MNIVAIDMVEKDCDRCGGSGRVPVFGLGLITRRKMMTLIINTFNIFVIVLLYWKIFVWWANGMGAGK